MNNRLEYLEKLEAHEKSCVMCGAHTREVVANQTFHCREADERAECRKIYGEHELAIECIACHHFLPIKLDPESPHATWKLELEALRAAK